MMRWIAAAMVALVPAADAAPVAQHYAVDPTSSATARVAFFGVTTRRARFPHVAGSVAIDPADPSRIAIDVSLDASALTADDDLTRNRLRGPAFFDVAHTREVRFVGGHLRLLDPTHATIEGTLTARGVPRPVTLDVVFSRPISQTAATQSLHLSGRTTLDRTDFGMTGYRLIVGRRVTVDLDITLRQQS
ncbi:YceI family protein [Sphingomonas sp. ST-64]|uniref:YceI family protein n=1 Tax=Sphingomonas plantiphila TaxID=3163295 RepID=A0ABW8YM07_9SPHN